MVKNTIKLCRKFLLQKINENMKRKLVLKSFVHTRVWRHLCQILNFPLHYFVKTNQNTTKLSRRFFHLKINKNMSWKEGWSFGHRFPLYWQRLKGIVRWKNKTISWGNVNEFLHMKIVSECTNKGQNYPKNYKHGQNIRKKL